MASSNKRERDLAREKARRQQTRRTGKRRRRIRASVLTAFLVVLAVVAGVAGVAALTGDDAADTLATEPTPAPLDDRASASPASDGGCVYREEGAPSRPVEQPPTGDEVVRSGSATITMATDRGEVVVEADAAAAPCTLNALASLASQDFFDGTPCHRLTTSGIFVLQCGDPAGDGTGGPGFRYDEENLPTDAPAAEGGAGQVVYPAGTMAMAKTAAPGSTGSQFFLVYADSPLDPAYTVVGDIVEGLDLVQAVADAGVEGGASDGPPAEPLTLEDVTVTYG